MKCRGNKSVMRAFVTRALSFSAVAALTLNPVLSPVLAADYRATAAATPVAADGQIECTLPCTRRREIHRDRFAA